MSYDAKMLLRVVAEHGPEARADLLQERAGLDARRKEINALIDALDTVVPVATAMTPNVGTLEPES